ncbi:hypothetical protein [uncultured Clostridium sp.]|uniref:hypothetical protein n=1 Tax=uncultured Clostridium sp. TaxID=59620 RepID=UPI0026350F7C|nr:hypothetical protein [uncultured Clostridium sp.]
MEKDILNQILPLIITGIVAILTCFIKIIGTHIISYLDKKEELLEHQIGIVKFEKELSIGKMVWNVVEENFRTFNLQDNKINKSDMFSEEIHKLLPELSEAQIETIRQGISGEINLGKRVLINPYSFNKK